MFNIKVENLYIYIQNFQGICQWQNFENRSTIIKTMAKKSSVFLLGYGVYSCQSGQLVNSIPSAHQKAN